MQGFPPVAQEAGEPAFHADWEAHVFALNRALIGRGVYNLDEFRDAIERMPPQQYLASSYYEKWFHAITTLVAELFRPGDRVRTSRTDPPHHTRLPRCARGARGTVVERQGSHPLPDRRARQLPAEPE